jgi:hypothetical protein
MSELPSTELSGYYAWTHTLQGVYYGPGSVSTALPKLLDTLGAYKALVVTGNSLYTKVCPINLHHDLKLGSSLIPPPARRQMS